MIERALYEVAFSPEWGRQMRFVSGPRQAGKTTLARQKLQAENCRQLYYLWDLRDVRQRYKGNELFFTQDTERGRRRKQWVCLDEIHKMPRWKNILKAAFDQVGERYQFIVTGSAKLEVLKRAGDSLAGRFFTFHLMPLVLAEVDGRATSVAVARATAERFIQGQLDRAAASPEALSRMLEYGGFPEAFQRGSGRFHKKWARDYAETVVREDIGTLTRIIDREHVFDLYNLLPEAVGSPVSESSLASHLQISPVTAKNYLRRLSDFYLVFAIRPYSRNIKRSLLKAAKVYLFDWTRITDPGRRFEDYVACELMARATLWSDATGDRFALFYIRNKQKQETDFLLALNDRPWLLVEAKTADTTVGKHHLQTADALGVPFVQVCRQEGIACIQKRGVHRISASRLFA